MVEGMKEVSAVGGNAFGDFGSRHAGLVVT